MADEEYQQAAQENVEEAAAAHYEEAPEENGTHEEADQGADEVAAEEEQAPEEADEPVAPEEEQMEGDVSDRHVFIAESHRIDESAMTIIRGLSAMTNIEDEDVRANIADLFADIQAEEANLFSPMPDYIARIIDAENAMRAERNKGVQPHDDVAAGETIAVAGSYGAERRAFVDPSKPLSLPYSLSREAKENPNRNGAAGTYHDLFYGDGSQCVFAPPEDNKRVQLEREKAAHTLPRRAPLSYEPAPRRTLKVDPDFVPSCATGVSASQRDSDNPVFRRSSGFALRNYKPMPKMSKSAKKSSSKK